MAGPRTQPSDLQTQNLAQSAAPSPTVPPPSQPISVQGMAPSVEALPSAAQAPQSDPMDEYNQLMADLTQGMETSPTPGVNAPMSSDPQVAQMYSTIPKGQLDFANDTGGGLVDRILTSFGRNVEEDAQKLNKMGYDAKIRNGDLWFRKDPKEKYHRYDPDFGKGGMGELLKDLFVDTVGGLFEGGVSTVAATTAAGAGFLGGGLPGAMVAGAAGAEAGTLLREGVLRAMGIDTADTLKGEMALSGAFGAAAPAIGAVARKVAAPVVQAGGKFLAGAKTVRLEQAAKDVLETKQALDAIGMSSKSAYGTKAELGTAIKTALDEERTDVGRQLGAFRKTLKDPIYKDDRWFLNDSGPQPKLFLQNFVNSTEEMLQAHGYEIRSEGMLRSAKLANKSLLPASSEDRRRLQAIKSYYDDFFQKGGLTYGEFERAKETLKNQAEDVYKNAAGDNMASRILRTRNALSADEKDLLKFANPHNAELVDDAFALYSRKKELAEGFSKRMENLLASAPEDVPDFLTGGGSKRIADVAELLQDRPDLWNALKGNVLTTIFDTSRDVNTGQLLGKKFLSTVESYGADFFNNPNIGGPKFYDRLKMLGERAAKTSITDLTTDSGRQATQDMLTILVSMYNKISAVVGVRMFLNLMSYDTDIAAHLGKTEILNLAEKVSDPARKSWMMAFAKHMNSQAELIREAKGNPAIQQIVFPAMPKALLRESQETSLERERRKELRANK